MKIEEISVDELKEYPNNPRNNEIAVDALVNSIREFGFKVPIVVDKDKMIVAGHTRLLASKKLGMKKVPCIVADDLTEEQVKAFRLADNKVAELATWDYEKLEQELREVQGIDMTEFEFDMLSEIDIDDFFEDSQKEQKEKPPKQIQCPFCGEWFEE